jgi:hypothetical protein
MHQGGTIPEVRLSDTEITLMLVLVWGHFWDRWPGFNFFE